jgi:hypothetical protein
LAQPWVGRDEFFLHSHDEDKVPEIAKFAVDLFNTTVDAGLKPLKLDESGGMIQTLF